jgi:CspA family cold shock protein
MGTGYTFSNNQWRLGNDRCEAAAIQPTIPGIYTMPEGKIKKLLDKGFGFINAGKDKDLFFHSSVVQGASFEELREGQKVSYTEGRGPKGPCAENVKPI